MPSQQPGMQGCHSLQQQGHQNRRKRNDTFEHRVSPDGAGEQVNLSRGHRCPEGQPAHVGHQHCYDSEFRCPEDRGQVAHPDHLVDQPSHSREQEA